MEWNNEKALKLIDMYREHECLWNPKRAEYKNKVLKLDAWQKISEEFVPKCDSLELKKKMESLLSSFRRERQKEECRNTTGKGAKEAYQSTWFAFGPMLFLLDKFEVKSTVNTEGSLNESVGSSMSDTQDDHAAEGLNDGDVDIGENIQETAQIDSGVNESTSTQTLKDRRPRGKLFKSPMKISAADKRRQQSAVNMACEYLKRKATEGPPEIRSAVEDECAIFGKLIAEQLRGLESLTRKYTMHEINSIIFEASVGRHPSSTPSHSPIQSPYSFLSASASPLPTFNSSSSSVTNSYPSLLPLGATPSSSPSPYSPVPHSPSSNFGSNNPYVDGPYTNFLAPT